jgi:shikimate kinase
VQPESYALLENNGVTLWLDAPFEVIRRRVPSDGSRPLAADAEKFQALYAARREQYRLADHRVEVESDDPEVTVNAILALKLFGL